MAVDNDYKGYRGEALTTLQKFSALIWSDIEVLTATKVECFHDQKPQMTNISLLNLSRDITLVLLHQEYSILKLPEEKKPTIKFPKKNSLTIPVNQE